MQRNRIGSDTADTKSSRLWVVSDVEGVVAAKWDLCRCQNMTWNSAQYAYRADLHPIDTIDFTDDKVILGR